MDLQVHTKALNSRVEKCKVLCFLARYVKAYTNLCKKIQPNVAPAKQM